MRNILLSLFLLGTALAGTACAQEPEAQARRAAIEAFYPVMIEALGRGDFAQARSLVQRAIAWEPQQAVHHYNLACIEARAGQAGAALAALGRAVALGYADAAHMAQDTDLASLHGYDQFRQLLAAAENAGPAPAAPGTAALAEGVRVRTSCYGTTAEGVVEQVEAGRYFVRFPAGNSSCDGWRDAGQVEALPPEPGRGGAFAAGAPVEALLNGNWQPAVVLAAEAGGYRVHYENYSAAMDAVVSADELRQTPERAGHRVGTGGPIPEGEYECYNFSYGGGLRYQTALTIRGATTYEGVDGGRGSYAKDAQGIVRFRGGAFDGQQADFQYNYGRAYLYMHVPDRPGERAGMDCEGPRPR